MKQTIHRICKLSLLIILPAILVFQVPVWAVESEDGKGVSKKLEDMFMSLLQTGEVVKDTEGRNILHLAVIHDRPGVVWVLGEYPHQAKYMMDAQDNDGKTPRVYAEEKNNPQMMDNLKELSAKCKDGETSLMRATRTYIKYINDRTKKNAGWNADQRIEIASLLIKVVDLAEESDEQNLGEVMALLKKLNNDNLSILKTRLSLVQKRGARRKPS